MAAAFVYAPENHVDILEKQLQNSLRPVRPNEDFVDHLHNRLASPVSMSVERRNNTAISLLLVSFSLLSGMLLIWLLNRLRAFAV